MNATPLSAYGLSALCLSMVFLSFRMEKQPGSRHDGMTYQFKVAKRGVMIADAVCHAWVPEHVEKIRTIIVHLHGCTREGDAKQMMFDVQWKELARKYDAVLIAPEFISGGNAKACANWYIPSNGSETVFMEMLDKLASKTGHSEIKTVPWTLWGHSGGSMWVTAMTGKYPDRVAVAVAQSCGVDISNIAAARKVPILHHNGIQDICNFNSTLVSKGRQELALWAHAVNPVVESPMDGHQVHNLRFLAIPWIDACLTERLPVDAGKSDLREMDVDQAWLGDTLTRTIVPMASYTGDKKAMYWFPNRVVAEKWREYIATGTVVDRTPPPAPFNLRASSEDNRIVLRWDARADLESGIKTFVIYRDGKLLQKLSYPTQTQYSKDTGYQRWNDGDQPAPVPAPEMMFVDVPTKKEHVYQVQTVNWSDIAGAKSEELRFDVN